MQPQHPPQPQQYAPRPPTDGISIAVVGIVIASIAAIIAGITYSKYDETALGDVDWSIKLSAAMAASGPLFIGGCVLAIGGAIVNAIARLRR